RALALPDVVYGGDVRVLERGGGLRLTSKAPHPVLICGHPCRQDFQCHHAVEPRVLGRVDFTHSPSAQQPLDLIVAERLAHEPLPWTSSSRLSRQLTDRLIQKTPCLLVRSKQRINLGKQRRISGASFRKKARALVTAEIERAVIDFLDLPPPYRVHHSPLLS